MARWLLGGLVLASLWGCSREASVAAADPERLWHESLRDLDGHRSFVPRLSADSPHVPCQALPEVAPPDGAGAATGLCANAPPRSGGGAARSAADRLADLPASSPRERWLRGFGRLVSARNELELDPAIDDLSDAVDRGAGSPAESDLAAALLVRAGLAGRPVALVESLGHSQRALAGEASLGSARFNRALALESLFLDSRAIAAWSDYLELDPDSGWAGEARHRLATLESHRVADLGAVVEEAFRAALLGGGGGDVADLVARHRTAARHFLEDVVLPEWSRAHLARRQGESSRLLNAAEELAGELSRQGGDRLPADALRRLRRDLARGDQRALDLLASAHLELRLGVARYGSFEIAAARESFESAKELFSAVGDPFEGWCDLYLALCAFQLQQHAEVFERLAGLHRSSARKGYLNLLGRLLWVRAAGHFYVGRPLDAFYDYQQSFEVFEESGEEEQLVSVRARIADVLRNMGHHEAAWHHRFAALRELGRVRDPSRRHFVVGEAALAAVELGVPEAARSFQEEAVAAARATGSAVQIAAAERELAAIQLLAGDPEVALGSLEAAARTGREVSTPELQRSLEAKRREVEARIALADDPGEATRLLGEAIEISDAMNYRSQLAELYLWRSQARRELGDVSGAVADLERCIAEIDAEWRRVLASRRRGSEEDLWPPYFDAPRRVFDAMVALLVDLGRVGQAFQQAERSKARDLLGLVTAAPGGFSERELALEADPLDVEQLQRSLADGVALVEYFLLEDRLLIWTVTAGSLDLQVVEIGRSEVEARVSGLRRELRARQPNRVVAADLEELYELLVRPAVERAGDAHALVFVPDGGLHGLPFAALRRAVPGRYLVEDYAVSVAPSATLYVRSTARDRSLGAEAPGTLIAASASTGPEFPGSPLPPLAGVISEAEEVASLYPQTTLLLGAEATEEAFLAEVSGHQVVHLAGHAVVNPERPYLSYLVLAPSGTEPERGVLYAHELLRERFPATRLIVLSACSSAGGHRIGAMGVAALVRPLLGAGIPAVVGSLWEVHDGATGILLGHFHRHYRAGLDAAEALRRAQLELVGSPERALRQVSLWAPFSVVGYASSPFENF